MRSLATEQIGGIRTVSGAGNIGAQSGSGPGYTWTRIAAGKVQVRFISPFKILGTVVATADWNSSAFSAMIVNTTVDMAEIWIVATTTGALSDVAFHFIATGR